MKAGIFLVTSFIVLLTALYWLDANAEGATVGPDCTFNWTANPPPTPDGYRLYIGVTSNDPNSLSADVGNVNMTTCSALNITTPGQYYARVTAYNTVGESGFSNEVPFVLVTTAPQAPSLTVQ